MRSATVPMTSLDSRMSSSVWAMEHKKDFDPTAKIDQSVFDDADEDATRQPSFGRTSSIESPTIHAPSYDSLLRYQSSDFRFPSVDSAGPNRVQSNDSCLQQLAAASVMYEDLTRTASSDSFRFPSVDSTPSMRLASTGSWQGSVNSDTLQNLLTAIAADKANQQGIASSYDFLSQHVLGGAPPPSTSSVQITIPPRPPVTPSNPPASHGFGPPKNKNKFEGRYVDDIRENDVLCGRGGKSNHHYGNKKYRQVVSEMKAGYRDISAKTAKTDLSRKIVDHVYEYGGRFLKRDAAAGRYYQLNRDEARKKTSQALRETKQLKWTIQEKK